MKERKRGHFPLLNNFEWCGEVLKHGSLDVGTVISVSVWPLKNGHFVYIPIIIGLRKVKWSFLRHHYRLSAYILTRRLVHNIHDVVTFATIGSHTYPMYFLTPKITLMMALLTKARIDFWKKIIQCKTLFCKEAKTKTTRNRKLQRENNLKSLKNLPSV